MIDTPGFDDTDVEEADIFEALAAWLEKSYRDGQRLKGLLYLHKIIDNRQKGSELSNIRVFRELCGDENLSNVTLGITWWKLEHETIARSREKVLRETPEFWGEIISKGSRVVRVPQDRFECIQLLLDIAQSKATTLQIQDEMVKEGRSALETKAAKEMETCKAVQALQDAKELEIEAQEQAYLQYKQAIEQKAEQRKKEQQRRDEQERVEKSKFEALLQRQRDQDKANKRQLEALRAENDSSNQRLQGIQKRIENLKLRDQKQKAQQQFFLEMTRKNDMRSLSLRLELNRWSDIQKRGKTRQESFIFNVSFQGKKDKISEDLCTSFCKRCYNQLSSSGFWRKICIRPPLTVLC